ncbi:MAG: hypothetical protein P4L49_04185 [Desulfosporosinus sp.]|nr:hypothetical protein [Desulfosporosinus sp.]
MFKGLPEVLGESSFLGLVLAGTAVVVLAPTLKNVLRGVAVATAKGVVSITEGGAALASSAKEGWEDVVAQAKAQKNTPTLDSGTIIGAGAGGAIGASIGGMAGPAGAAIGGGLGSVTGASVGSGMNQDMKFGTPEDKPNE